MRQIRRFDFKEQAMIRRASLSMMVLAVVGVWLGTSLWKTGVADAADIESLADAALSDDPTKVAHAVETLRAHGPEALDVLFAMRDRVLPRHNGPLNNGRIARSTGIDVPEDRGLADVSKALKSRIQQQQRIEAVIDQVGGQRYCSLSRLYWYTDIKQAEKAARSTGKPILSLRLLGKLTDELSCANSRFFRTTLYSNQQIAKYLRTHFVLHWKSVRPVPVVTIDFGDGRKLKRTLTGNSIHYVLATDGAPIDALPGLYAPATFLENLQRAEQVARRASAMAGDERKALLNTYHAGRLEAIAAAWQQDRDRVQAGQKLAANPVAGQQERRTAIRVTAEKLRVLEAATDDADWKKIAALHHGETKLDAATISVMRKENPPTAAAAMRVTVTKSVVEDPILRMVRRFRSDLALDTVRNEYLLHSRLHQWFVEGKLTTDVEELNRQVYARVFLTPSSDPWIGLVKPSEYTALVKSGVISRTPPRMR
jgi:DNA-directed RNA polymerase subunit N (RpoN/RPB10)